MAYLSDMAVGDIVKVRENGVPVDFIVCKHDYESGLNGAGRTLLLRKDVHSSIVWNANNANTYHSSDIDTWLNGTYKDSLDKNIQELLGSTTFYFAKGQGNFSLSKLSRPVFLFSATELGYSNTYLLKDGTPLPNANDITSNASVIQWTRSVCTNDLSANQYYVWYLMANCTSENKCNFKSANESVYVRPAFTLPESTFVSSYGLLGNSRPVITGITPSGSDVGEISEPTDFTYSVTDEDGDEVTVSEYLDNVVQREFTATLGAENTFGTVSNADDFRKILNGSHEIKLIASDNLSESKPYVITFNKQVRTAVISLKNPLPADDVIKAAVLNITGKLPEDSTLEVLATNNALDSEPVWEDMTRSVKNGTNHVFTNQAAANGFAFNFKVTLTRGVGDEEGYISNIGGAFE